MTERERCVERLLICRKLMLGQIPPPSLSLPLFLLLPFGSGTFGVLCEFVFVAETMQSFFI